MIDDLMAETPSPARDLTRDAVSELYGRGLLDLVFLAAQTHRQHHDPAEVQCAALLSVKNGRLSGGLRLLSAIGALQDWCRKHCPARNRRSPKRGPHRTIQWC